MGAAAGRFLLGIWLEPSEVKGWSSPVALSFDYLSLSIEGYLWSA